MNRSEAVNVDLTIPAQIDVPTTLYTRFRLTEGLNQGGDSPTGPADSGEVEDYVLMSFG